MNAISTKEEVYEVICNASLLGALGMFVGSGFTKAILEKNERDDAYSWAELLEECCNKMDVDSDVMKTSGSYSEIASQICKQHSLNNEDIKYLDSVAEMKKIICDLTTVFPDKLQQDKYGEYFSILDFNWIATTNYDTILESIFCGKALSITPEGCFTKIKNMIPVYHIHGIRSNPHSIVITNEDYTHLFRPNDYRQARLPFLMKESLVLMIGYGLGDINVLTAVDWAKNVFTNISEDYDFPIIQLLYKADSLENPYQDDSGITILEVNDLGKFFDDLCSFYEQYKQKYNEKITEVNNYVAAFNEAEPDVIKKFIDNTDEFRDKVIEFVPSLSQEFGYIYVSYLNFLRTVIDKLNEEASKPRCFEAYDQKLVVILDILEKVPLKAMPSSFFAFVVRSLDSVASHTGKGWGEAWEAAKTWDKRSGDLPEVIVEELQNFIRSNQGNSFNNVRKLLNPKNRSSKDRGFTDF